MVIAIDPKAAINTLPERVRSFIEYLMGCGIRLWLVGSQARRLSTGNTIDPSRDYDVVASGFAGDLRSCIANWSTGHYTLDTNSFGGTKLTLQDQDEAVFGVDTEIDVWAADIGEHLAQCPKPKQGTAVCLKTGAVVVTGEFVSQPEGDEKIVTRVVSEYPSS